MKTLAPLRELDVPAVQAVFSDLDGTLTVGQGLPSRVHAAMERLKAHGLPVVLVSGRPAGWADCLTRLLPIDAMIFENGAGIYVREGKKIVRIDLAGEVKNQQTQLRQIFQELNKRFGPLSVAKDQAFRMFDYAIDLTEEAEVTDTNKVEMILEALRQTPNVHAKLSSIHINYWLGTYDKRTAVEYLLKTHLGALAKPKEAVLFCGDSPNDEPLFAYFPQSVGMANLTPFLNSMRFHPTFLSTKNEGDGFVEVAETLVPSRG